MKLQAAQSLRALPTAAQKARAQALPNAAHEAMLKLLPNAAKAKALPNAGQDVTTRVGALKRERALDPALKLAVLLNGSTLPHCRQPRLQTQSYAHPQQPSCLDALRHAWPLQPF